MTIVLHREKLGDGQPDSGGDAAGDHALPLRVWIPVRHRPGRCAAPAIPVPDEAHPVSRFSDAEERAIATLSARHTSCDSDFQTHPDSEDPPTMEWDEIWSESKARDPFGECRIKELGDSLRRTRQQDPSRGLFQ
jgi:hypothetical protein